MKKINWSAYNKELINRGSLTLWFNLEEKGQWYSEEEPKGKGRLYYYSWIAIELITILRFRFGPTLRGVQGFAQSIFKWFCRRFENFPQKGPFISLLIKRPMNKIVPRHSGLDRFVKTVVPSLTFE